MRPLRLSAPLICSAAFAAFAGLAAAQNSYVNFEGKQTRPICLSPDGTRLFAVNTPDARLSVFDVTRPLNPFLLAEVPVGLEPVSVNARSNDEIWVVNEVSDSVSVVSVSRKLVTDTLYVKDEPADVVFAGGKAFVSAARKNQIAVFDAVTHTLLTNIVLFGENPRSLAVNTNGTKVYAAFALSGNRTTLIPPELAPPQPTNGTPAMKTNLPPPPQVSLIVEAANPAWTNNVIRYTMPDNDVAEIDVATLTVSRYFPRVGTVNFALAVQPITGDLFVANTDARNLTHFEPALRGFFVTNRFARINVTSGSVTNFDLNRDYHPTNFTLLDKTNALAQPTALAFGPSGANFYLAAFGSDRIARVAANSGNVVSRIELNPGAVGSAADPRNKRGPRGLALLPGVALYSLNRISGTISVINPTTDSIVREIPIGSHDPTPVVVRNGRGFLYDAKLSGNGTVSCSSCHIDAEMDLIAWDLGDPQGTMGTNFTIVTPAFPIGTNQPVHPMKGPMTTQTLRGLKGLAPLHWRGDRTNFQHFNGAFASLLGGSPLSAADMQAYADFIETVVFQPNPNQNLNRTYPTNFAGGNAEAGRNTFFNEFYQPTLQLACTTCHTGPPGSGSNKQIFARQALEESQDFKVPHLRNVYQKLNFNNAPGALSIGGFGIVHDGVDPNLFVFLSRDVFGLFANDTTRKNNLSSFVQCFDTGMAPAVGYSRTLQMSNVFETSIAGDWSLLEAQAVGGTNINLVVKGTLDGRRRGLLYQPGPNNYQPDSISDAPLTRAELTTKVLRGDTTLTLMGVPPGSGQRMAIDRDADGVLDADEPLPALQISQAGSRTVLSWPYGAAGFSLEETPNLVAGSWNTSTNPVTIANGLNYVTNSPGAGARFFRLRQQ
jgi:YVTN family beta-propeller protein